jgi:hypothetical protein
MKWAKSRGATIASKTYSRAAEAGSPGAVKWLVEEGGWREQVVRGAALGGHWEILLWAKEESYMKPSRESSKIVAPCAQNGDLEILEFLVKEGYTLTSEFIVSASTGGHVNVLKWIISKNPLLLPVTFLLLKSLLRAIKGKHVDTLEFLLEKFGVTGSTELWQCASKHGNLEIYKILRKAGVPWDVCTSSSAAHSGDLNVLKWLSKHGCPFSDSRLLWQNSVDSGNLEVLKWLRDLGCPWEKVLCEQAALTGNFEILNWARENGCPWNKNTCSGASEAGNFEILRWARENGCPWDENTCAAAAKGGHFEILRWVHENGCPWDENTCVGAARSGNLEILQWAREHGCPWDTNTYDAAERKGHSEILKWAVQNGCPKPSRRKGRRD